MRPILATLVLLASTAASTAAPLSIYSVPAVSFDDLFGMTESTAAAMVDAKTFRCLKFALVDFNLAAAGNRPRHSKLESLVADGGTTNWRGDCYDLSVLMHGVGMKDGKGCYLGFIFGPSLRIRDRDEWPMSISRTKLVNLQPEPCN